MPTAEAVQQLDLPVTDTTAATSVPSVVMVGEEPSGSSKTTGDSVVPKAPEKPFILSEGLPPVPHKLAARIWRGEFIDMAELLRDNLEAQRRTSASQQPASASSTAKNRREVPDLLSWVQCFGTYMAVVTSKAPHRMKQLLAYQTLIVREARRCGGRGWLAYDSYFRQQVVGDESADWSRLNQSLYAVTFITQADKDKGRSCVLCLEGDHTEEQCALYSPPIRPAGSSRRATSDRNSSDSRESPATARGRAGSRMACFAWNQGDCRFPACKYRHVCVRCSGDHRVSRCAWPRSDRDSKLREAKAETDKR